MNKKILISLLIVVLLIALGFVYYSNLSTKKSDLSMNGKTDSPTEKSMDKMDKVANESAKSKYLIYSEGALTDASQNRRVLFFYASWCPTCRPADSEFLEKASSLPDNLTLIRVNYNDPDTDQNERDLARKYNVTYQHTFVQIDQNGNEIKKWNGGSLAEIIENIN